MRSYSLTRATLLKVASAWASRLHVQVGLVGCAGDGQHLSVRLVRDVTTSTDHEKVFVTQKSAVHIHNKNNLNRQAHVQQ